MGAPPPEMATPGRANPRGIPYLYGAEDDETALHEVMPPIGATVSVGKFVTNRDLKFIDLTNPGIESPFRYADTLKDLLSTLALMRKLGQELSMPVDKNRADILYLPTQYLCELIKTLDFDGARYRSSYTGKWNMVFFDPAAGSCVAVSESRVSGVKYSVG